MADSDSIIDVCILRAYRHGRLGDFAQKEHLDHLSSRTKNVVETELEGTVPFHSIRLVTRHRPSDGRILGACNRSQ